MNLFTLTLTGAGSVLLYSAVKGYNPRDVVMYALGGPKPVSFSEANQQDNNLANSGRSDGSPAFPRGQYPDGPTPGGPVPTPGGANAGPLLNYSGNPTTDTPMSV